MRASLDGSASAYPTDRLDYSSQPFLVCCFAQKGDLCLPLFRHTSRTELVSAVTRSEVVRSAVPIHNAFHETAIHHQVVSRIASALSLASV